MHHVEEGSDLTLEDLPTYNARQVRDGISANDLDDARGIVTRLERLALCPDPADPSPSASPRSSASPSPKTSERNRKSAAESSPSKSPSKSPTKSPTASPSEGAAVCTEAP
jgi:protein phosphatase